MPVSKIPRSLSNRRQRAHNCEKHRRMFACHNWVHVFKEWSKTSTMHLGVLWPSDIVERVEGRRPKAADERAHRHGKQVCRGNWRDDKHGKPMGTMSVQADQNV